MKKILVMILLAFTFNLFSPEADADTVKIGAPAVKIHKKHRRHHRWHWHHHHHHHREIIIIKR